MFNFFRNRYSVFHSGCPISHPHQLCTRIPTSPHPPPVLFTHSSAGYVLKAPCVPGTVLGIVDKRGGQKGGDPVLVTAEQGSGMNNTVVAVSDRLFRKGLSGET